MIVWKSFIKNFNIKFYIYVCIWNKIGIVYEIKKELIKFFCGKVLSYVNLSLKF